MSCVHYSPALEVSELLGEVEVLILKSCDGAIMANTQ
jgi:hypothetical protein